VRASGWTLTSLLLFAGCGGADEARIARDAAAEAERVEGTVRDDFSRIEKALEKHAPALAAGLAEEAPDAKRRALYLEISPWRQLKAGGKAVFDLQTAPIEFLAVVDAEGKMVVRDHDPEKSYRTSMRERFPAVAAALGGRTAVSHGELPDGQGEALLAAVPIRGASGVVGAVLAPITYFKVARRLERQHSLDATRRKGGATKAPTVRVALFAGSHYYSGSIQPELDPTRPSVRARTKKLGSGRAYSETVQVLSRTFGIAVRRLEFLEGDADVGILCWRSDPVDL
jgi:hypothetical protein